MYCTETNRVLLCAFLRFIGTRKQTKTVLAPGTYTSLDPLL